MRLEQIGSNQTQVTTTNGTVVLFSYSTPVAARTVGGALRTSTTYSRTTTRHINAWLAGVTAKEVSQVELDRLLEL